MPRSPVGYKRTESICQAGALIAGRRRQNGGYYGRGSCMGLDGHVQAGQIRPIRRNPNVDLSAQIDDLHVN